MDIAKSVLKWIVVLGMLAILVNDSWRYVSATYQLEDVTREAASRSLAAVKPTGGDPGKVWEAGQLYAESKGVNVYGFELKPQSLHIWTRAQVRGTVVVERIAPFFGSVENTTAFVIENDRLMYIPNN